MQVEFDKFKRGLELGAVGVWLYQCELNSKIIFPVNDDDDDIVCQTVLQ